MRDQRKTRQILGLALVSVLSLTAPLPGDTVRVKTDRGVVLVESTDSGLTALASGDELILTRSGGEEVRLRLDAIPGDSPSRLPLLVLRRDGKPTLTVRRLADPPKAPMVAGPGRTLLNPKGLAAVWSLAITPDGKTIVTGHWGAIRVWDGTTLAERYNIPLDRNGRRVAITPDGSTIVSAEFGYVGDKAVGNVVIRDGKTGAKRKESKQIDAPHGVAIEPTGKIVVSSSWAEAGMRVWETETGEQAGTLKGHDGVVETISYSPDGKLFASAGNDHTVRLWDVDTGEVRRVLRGHQGGVESIAFSGDGKVLASGGFDDDARVWDVTTGQCLATFEFDNPVLAVAISPDGKALATASSRWGDGFYGQAPAEVRVWDVATSKPIAILPDQPNQIFAMVFKPDGKTLITGSLSGAVILWDLSKFPAPAPADAPKPAPATK